MNLTKINCPKCNSLQEFRPKYRKTDNPKVFTKYIRCSKCRKEWVLGTMPRFLVYRERKIASHKRAAEKAKEKKRRPGCD